MTFGKGLGLAVGLLACACVAGTAEEVVYLDATFDDQTIDAPIGTGGAALGEPIFVEPEVTAIVRAAPFASPSLEVQDVALQAGRVAFEFLEDAEVTSGLVVIALDLWFSGMTDADHEFGLYVREHGSSAQQFLNMFFWGDGRINVASETDGAFFENPFPFGRSFPLLVVVNLDTGQLAIWLDGVLEVADMAHGVVGRGIGRVEIGTTYDEDQLPTVWVDRLRVSNTPPDTPVEATTWGKVKALFRP